MILELLAATILWIGIDDGNRLQVSCDEVTIDLGLKYNAKSYLVTFEMKDSRTWVYTIPMQLNTKGYIVLKPTDFWIEEIRQRKNLELSIEGKDYTFNLKGTKNLINCDGVVAQ